MTMTKEQLLVEYEKAKDARESWRTDYYNMKGERDKLQEEVDNLRWSLQKSRNQIHFLAGMLYGKGISIDEYAGRLDIIVEEKHNEETKPIYGTITNGNTFSYCNANK